MRIEHVIHSSDSNPYYLDFWPLVSRVWKEKFKMTPILLYVDEDHTVPIDETYGIVYKFKPVSGIPIYLQCLWIRYWFPSQNPNTVSMISDIDMFPLSKTYFIEQIRQISDTKYVHLNPFHQNMPSCYHVALGSLFTKILDLHPTWEESIRHLYSLQLGKEEPMYDNLIGKTQWGADEEYATKKIRTYPDQSLFVFLNRTLHRLDRTNWSYNPFDIQNGYYADAHSIRPYSDPRNRDRINKLMFEIERYV